MKKYIYKINGSVRGEHNISPFPLPMSLFQYNCFKIIEIRVMCPCLVPLQYSCFGAFTHPRFPLSTIIIYKLLFITYICT